MKKLLLVCATSLEIEPLLERMSAMDAPAGKTGYYLYRGLMVDVMQTGVGMVSTAYHTGRALMSAHYDLVVNAGVGGSFHRFVPIGSVLHVVSEEMPEMGAEAKDSFISIFDLGLEDPDSKPFTNGKLVNNSATGVTVIENLTKVHGITVNTVHGQEDSIHKVLARCNPVVESMEGAAFFFACAYSSIPYAQLRGISNYVEKRNRSDWDIPLAVRSLNNILINILDELADGLIQETSRHN